jgi:SAM-dependent methyltransferase
MIFSVEWDRLYAANQHMSVWPWSDLVAYVHRYAKPTEGFRRVLELGCGAGANIPLFKKLDVDYSAIDGSPAIVALLHGSFPELKDKIVVGDFTKLIPFEGPFDYVVDRGSLTCNNTASIRQALRMTFDLLRRDGKLIGIDWFSTKHAEATGGDELDSNTRTNITSRQLAGVGAVHFSDRDHLVGLLTGVGFRVDRLEHKQNDIIIPAKTARLAWWNFVAVKT